MTEKEPKWKRNRPYLDKYSKETIKQYLFKVNKKYDSDIIEFLDSLDNKNAYLKDLIRADIAQSKKDPN